MNGMVPQDKMQDFSGRIYHESERLSNLVADIIQLSRLDEKNGETMFEPVDLGELGEDVINNLQNRAAKKKIRLEYAEPLHRFREYVMYCMKCFIILRTMLYVIHQKVERLRFLWENSMENLISVWKITESVFRKTSSRGFLNVFTE